MSETPKASKIGQLTNQLRLKLRLAQLEVRDSWRRVTSAPEDELGRGARVARNISSNLGRVRHEVRRRRGGATRVYELMSRQVGTCTPGDDLRHALELMWNGDYGCVPIVDDARRVIGLVTDRDAAMASYTRGVAPADIPVTSASTDEVHTCSLDESIETALEKMRRYAVRRLPVVDDEGRLAGMLSLADVAVDAERHGRARRDDVARTLAAISETRTPQTEVGHRATRIGAETV